MGRLTRKEFCSLQNTFRGGGTGRGREGVGGEEEEKEEVKEAEEGKKSFLKDIWLIN